VRHRTPKEYIRARSVPVEYSLDWSERLLA
jgi:hypothetical protein